ncbi:hypothetical protein L7F22_026971 [Adiantum nelumboides]|nr:hypothetical protein [Adiantum nelumboides]
MAGGPAAGKGKGKAKGEMRGKYSSPKAKQGWEGEGEGKGGDAWKVFQSQGQARVGPRAQDPFATYETGQGVRGKGPRSFHEEPSKAPNQEGKDPEGGLGNRRNHGDGKQKGTTSEAVRSPKPHVQSIAKNKVGVEQQKEIAQPSKVPPPNERNKAEKKQGLGKGKEKSVCVGSQKPHEDIPAQKTQGAEIQKETAGSFEDPRMQKKKANKKPGSEKPTETAMSSEVVGSQIIHENSAGEKKQGLEKGKIPSLIEFSRMLLEEDCAAKLPKQQAKKTKGKGSLVNPTEKLKSADLLLSSQLYVELHIDGKLVRMCRVDPACPSRNTQMEKRTRMMDHLKKQHGLNVAIPNKVGGRVGGVSLNLVSKSSIRDQIRTQERFQEVDRKYEVNREGCGAEGSHHGFGVLGLHQQEACLMQHG